MKKTFLITTLAALSLLFIPVLSHAQAPDGQKDKTAAKGDRAEKLKSELGLTDEQASKLQALMAGQKDKMIAIKDDQSLSKDQKKEKMKALRQETDTALDAILTPEQKAKHKEMMEKMREKKQAQGGGAGGAPASN